ncbi:LytR/AlgR family response regulator transcription factor [Nitrosopumilus adriaticus]|uniref:LytR/AlgR family response regulator transcription factor n=1 Tax=Nitrosopumilus adriaticus TaxID=1580092 RepID=UPI00352E4ABC
MLYKQLGYRENLKNSAQIEQTSSLIQLNLKIIGDYMMVSEVKHTCIIIDDMKSHQFLLSQMVEICGLEVIGVGENGKVAIELFQNLKPDIVFLDMRMPKYDGFFAIDGINKIDDSAKIVAVTADTTSDTFGKLNSLHIPVLSKPYTMETLQKIVDKELVQN